MGNEDGIGGDRMFLDRESFYLRSLAGSDI